ncbi:MAG: nitrate reductase subunit alpha [Meiothermus sp.]|jgi:nitrate reductase alpha subunit|uniref:nitrate reductase subunit alpha n=1 Tax=Meiothermus ruber TaxID=277 RepID=UPI0021DD4B76|nr:nitrate reductase subunit alpha [Meiothermus sp.]GIW38960.1 MAG: nitrate reductase subunit alpha [Meiothermus sp.]
MSDWIKELEAPTERKWEEFYRNRFAHDKRVRTTHGVNCTGSCSWEVFVKDGIVTWELQATDYPAIDPSLPDITPRGCQRGVSYSWYLYSPIRVKYPYARGALIDLWREAREQHADPVAAWKSLVSDPEKRRRWQRARGKGGFRRFSWEEALDIIAASLIHTIQQYGPDRIIGFSPIPAMSQISYAAGSRFLSLIGGVPMSFYDWYCDLPNASPEIWGEQTDVHEAADWYNARFIAVVGSNLNMTRTPDVHYVAEGRYAGAKFTVFAPDFNQVAKYADWWLPIHPGQDGAFWMAVNHVILKEFYLLKQVPYFVNYLKRYTDSPMLVEVKDGRPGRYLRASQLADYADEENGDWKLLVWDERSGAPRMPGGTIGFRWQSQKGKWNLELKDARTGQEIDPLLSFRDQADEVLQLEFDDFGADKKTQRGVPVKKLTTKDGQRVTVTTVFDLLMAQFGVDRGLGGDYPQSYDEVGPYTPAWQEQYTGIHRDTLIRYAREWAENGEKTQGKNLIIIGAGANHWYHNNLLYRAGIVALMLTGSVGVNGGGLAHYVGQEKLANQASWGPIAFAGDWGYPARQQNTPSFHYVHSDQWRYERGYKDYDKTVEKNGDHTIDHQARAVRKGWLPFFPQFNKSSLEVVKEAEKAGARTEQEIVAYVVQQLKEGQLEFAIDDPDAPSNWPRVWFIWRGNAIGTSAKGHEFFLKHYLGTHTNTVAQEQANGHLSEVRYRREAPQGKLDLVVDLNFRMDTSALYSDIVLPTASWYEKDDLNTTDLHTYINPMQAAVPPLWESKSDWDIYKAIAQRFSELAQKHLAQPVRDIVMIPLQHDTPDELAQPDDRDWKKGQVEPIPGKTMPKFRVVERQYPLVYEKMVSLGDGIEKNGVGMHGLSIPAGDFYDDLRKRQGRKLNGAVYPSLESARQVAEAILYLDPVSNGELAYRAFKDEEKKTGVKLTDLAEPIRDVRISFSDIVAQPRRQLTTPTWSAIINQGRPYSPFTLNVERLIPWRTLSGRQHFYLDHENYLAWGEHLPTYKPRPDHTMLLETEITKAEAQGKLLNYITPHGKWSIHSTYSDNHRMMTLSRGGYPIWLNDKDAQEMGIRDNDWVELFNDNGVFVQRCIVSARIPRGTVFVYHATERTLSVPKSPLRGKRAGMNNSITRARLKPVLMSGGYAQFTYAFNYWGPVGVNRDTFVYVRRIEQPQW